MAPVYDSRSLLLAVRDWDSCPSHAAKHTRLTSSPESLTKVGSTDQAYPRCGTEFQGGKRRPEPSATNGQAEVRRCKRGLIRQFFGLHSRTLAGYSRATHATPESSSRCGRLCSLLLACGLGSHWLSLALFHWSGDASTFIACLKLLPMLSAERIVPVNWPKSWRARLQSRNSPIEVLAQNALHDEMACGCGRSPAGSKVNFPSGRDGSHQGLRTQACHTLPPLPLQPFPAAH